MIFTKQSNPYGQNQLSIPLNIRLTLKFITLWNLNMLQTAFCTIYTKNSLNIASKTSPLQWTCVLRNDCLRVFDTADFRGSRCAELCFRANLSSDHHLDIQYQVCRFMSLMGFYVSSVKRGNADRRSTTETLLPPALPGLSTAELLVYRALRWA